MRGVVFFGGVALIVASFAANGKLGVNPNFGLLLFGTFGVLAGVAWNAGRRS